MMEFSHDHMLILPELQADIVARCLAGNFGDEPSQAAHPLGDIQLPDGSRKPVWLCHAADAVLLDDCGQTVLITRLHNPGRGKQAIPGGLLDVVDGRVELSRTAALREAMEETGISAAVLAGAQIRQIGHRRFARPFDIRCAWNDLSGLPVRKGDFFTVSTLGFAIRIAGDLRDVALLAGDDATAVHVLKIAALTPAQFAVPDHIEMVREACG
jgi:8-oxo-dGTP pyrophosphatase MutT (NUDIX family)